MEILVIGGTRFFGPYTIRALLEKGHNVTIATRGNATDPFGDRIARITLDRTDFDSMRRALAGKHFDVVIDKIAYCSNEIKSAMEILDCDRYIYMSTTAVYDPKHIDTKEEDFNGTTYPFCWSGRGEHSYDVMKRYAECALWQIFPDKKWLAVRYPFVIGRDDYTKRLRFYVEHTMKAIPMYIDNIDAPMGFIDSSEAGVFMAYLVDKEITGAINGCSNGAIALREIINYVEEKVQVKAVLDKSGDPAPYNGEPAYSICTEKASSHGFTFSNLRDWIFDLIDYYIEEVRREMT